MLLQPCTADNITLPLEIEDRFKELALDYVRKRGVTLQVPLDLQTDWNLFLGLRQRHRAGDFRQTEDEAMAVQRIAWWTVRVHAALRGQEPPLSDFL